MTEQEKQDILNRIDAMNESLSKNPNYIDAIIQQREELAFSSARKAKFEASQVLNPWKTSPGI